MNLPEYVLYTLGARPVAELSNATHTQLVNLEGTWSSEILEALRMSPGSMPDLVQAGTSVGMLRSSELQELSAFKSTRLIAPACHDTASAIAAIPDDGADWAYISSGTWSLVGTLLEEPVNTVEAMAENFTNLAGADGTTCFHKNVNGMWLLRQCLEEWNRAEEDCIEIAALVEAAATVKAREFLLHVDDPDLLLPGEMPQRINRQLKTRGLPEFDPAPEAAAELAAFIFHSLAARYAEVLQTVASITGRRFKRLYIMGGGSQNQLLNRLTAEATDLTVVVAGTECSTLGNFASQMAALERTAGRRPTTKWARVLNPL